MRRILPLLLLAAFSGCLQTTEGSLQLADLRECSFLYPDGSAIPCETTYQTLDAGGAAPGLADGWGCDEGLAGYRHYRHVDGREGIEYPENDMAGPFQVILHAQNVAGDDVASWVWGDEDGAGFVELPPRPESAENWAIRRYTTSVESPTSLLQEASAEIVWSTYDQTGYPLVRVDAEGGPYWLQTVIPFRVEGGPTWYYPAPVHLKGDDFELLFDVENDGGYGWGAEFSLVGPCALG